MMPRVRTPISRTGLRAALLLVLVATLAAAPGQARAQASIVHTIVTYLPNRVLDVFDVVRLRARVGPGVAVDLRATEVADVFLGAYTSVYAGLPGPRGRRTPRLPVGLEALAGAEVGPADASTGGGLGPDYGTTEVGVGVHALLVGLDVGVDPFEILDLVLGLIALDPADDDY